MRKIFSKSNIPRFILLTLLPVLAAQALSQAEQDVINAVADTAVVETIPIDEIPVATGETALKLLKLEESLITQEAINREQRKNDSLMSKVDSLIKLERQLDYQQFNNRYLRNKLNIWTEIESKVKNQQQSLSAIIKKLTDKQKDLAEELDRWRATGDGLDMENVAPSISSMMDEVMTYGDSINRAIVDKTNQLFQILEKTTAYALEVVNIKDVLAKTIDSRQVEIFARTHPALYAINLSSDKHFATGQHITLFIETDVDTLQNYYKNNRSRFILNLIFLVLLIILFFYSRNRIGGDESGYLSTYQKRLREIMSRPLSAALTLGLFSTVLFLPNRPILFIDLTILLVSIPLIDIILKVADRKSHKFIYVFIIMVFLRFINFIIPPEDLMYRLIIMIMAIAEIFVLWLLIRYIRTIKFKSSLLVNFVRLLIYFHILTAFTGLIANIFGYITLAGLAVNFAVTNAFVGFLLIISSIIIIGLAHLAIDSGYLRRLNIIRRHGYHLKKRTAGLVSLGAMIFWFTAILNAIGVRDNFYAFLDSAITNEFRIGSVEFTIGSIILFFFVIWLSVVISNIIRAILEDDVLHKFELKKGVPRTISVMARFTIITIGIFLAIGAVGMPLDNLAIIFGAFSVGIGFGLQNIFNNLVSGLILLFERPVQIGDTIEVGNLIGTVKSMGIRSSNVRTFDGAEVIVPNGNLISNEVVNWTLSDQRRRIEIISGVAYGSDVHKVQDLMKEILAKHPDVIDDPEPLVLFNEMNESSLDFRLLFWTDQISEWIRIRSEVVFMIHDKLYAEGISIPFPQRDLHIKTIDGKINMEGSSTVGENHEKPKE
jgi:small-conductance mechanosensitive channel/predicted CopG family antitoxin